MGVVIALVAFEAWMLVLRAPLAEMNSLVKARAPLPPAASGGGAGAEIERLLTDTAANARALATASARRSDDATVLALIDVLGRVAGRHAVALGSVRAGRHGVVAGVDEQTYEVEARGTYRALHGWLSEAGREIAPLVVAEFALRSLDEGRRASISLRLAAYRTAVAPPTPP